MHLTFRLCLRDFRGLTVALARFAQVDFCDYVVGPTWEQLSNALGEEPLIKEAQRNMGQNRSSWHLRTAFFLDAHRDISVEDFDSFPQSTFCHFELHPYV